MSTTQPPCLIIQDACGREEGNPVCPKCGIDDRVVYPGQGDLEVALTAAKAKYWEAHARQLEEAAKAKAEQTAPKKSSANGGNTTIPAPPPPTTLHETPSTPPKFGKGKAVIAIAIAAIATLSAGGWWWKVEQDDRARRANAAAQVAQAEQANKVAQIQTQLQTQAQAAEKARLQEAERAEQLAREKQAAELAREEARKSAEASDAAQRVAEAQAARAVAAAATQARPPAAAATPPSEPVAAPRQAWEPQMVVIPAGHFTMGSGAQEQQLAEQAYGLKKFMDYESPQRLVSIRRFQLGKYEVTQGQWKAVMGNNPSQFSNCGDNCPVERVSWNDIQQFIQKLNQKTGNTYRLPSEAEWEYAARAGCQSAFNVAGQCKEKIESREANFDGNATYNGSAKGQNREKTLPAGSFQPNSFGLYDMHGNIGEWVQDCFEDNYNKGQPTDGGAHRANDSSCTLRVLRGGSWSGTPEALRSAYRGSHFPDSLYFFFGFRLARTVP